jgi:YVTN family beta-propeller protein
MEVAAGPAGLWAITYSRLGSRTLLEHIDVDSRRAVGPPLVLSHTPADGYVALAVGARDVWVTHFHAVPANQPDRRVGTVLRIDAMTNEVVAHIPVDHNPAGLVVTSRGIWVTSEMDDMLSRIDPATNRVVFSIPVGDGPEGVFASAGSIWINDTIGDPRVERIDPRSGDVEARFVGATLELVANGFAWLTTTGPPNGQLRHVDLDTNEFVGPIFPLDITPVGLVALDGQLWLGRWVQDDDPLAEGPVIGGDFTLFRFHPRSNETSGAGLVLSSEPAMPVVAGRAFWITTTKAELIRVEPEAVP